EEVYEDVKGETLSREDFVATMLATRSVKEVSMVLEVLDKETIDHQNNSINVVKDISNMVSSKQCGKGRKHKKVTISDVALKITQDASSTHRVHYTACDHEGPCSLAVDCVCMLNGTHCEKYCGCQSICKNRFPGCNCRIGGCMTNKCPCFIARRECDPDVCHYCGAYIPAALRGTVQLCCDTLPAISKTFRMLCRNVNYAHLHTKKTLVKRSNVHGWGLFLAENVEEGEFVIEYGGEAISHHEAERRGRVYDLLDRTYLFHLNNQLCIDATQAGNKAKFINHNGPRANLVPRIILARGEHVVILLAKRNIQVGEELFFDYQFAKVETTS
ncbi:SET domain-containing protein, partial [archaeon]